MEKKKARAMRASVQSVERFGVRNELQLNQPTTVSAVVPAKRSVRRREQRGLEIRPN